MPKHEHFEELAALGAVGQLSAEEFNELSDHLRECEDCRDIGSQYEFILDQLPIPDVSAGAHDLQGLQSVSYRQRFFKRATEEGLRFTSAALGGRESRSSIRGWRPFLIGAATAAVFLLAFALSVVSQRFWSHPETSSVQPRPVETPTRASASDVDTTELAASMAELERAKIVAENRLKALGVELAKAESEKRLLLAELDRWKDEASQLQGENQESKAQLAESRNELEKARNDRDQLTASLVAQEIRIKDLSQEIQLQIAAVERERQLTAAAGDVRELMGARNLHIIDVADLDGRGKSKQSFGRVFYTEGKSLIFYAFDLSQKGSAGKVSFQAWGQSPTGSRVKNLGIFHIDDQLQKRWVLRVDDPTLLSSIESIFVTIEPSPGRDRPSGQKLLYAYLGIPANHP